MTHQYGQHIEDSYLPITIESQKTCHRGFRDVVSYTYREDRSGLTAEREVVSARQAVAVVAHDPGKDALVMIRQFRLGAQLGTGRGFSIELAAGMIDDGELPEASARRELHEETGLEAGQVQSMCTMLTSPGLSNEVLHLFYAQVNATSVVRQAGHALENEQTFPFLISPQEAMEAVDSNRIQNGITMIGLMWYARNRKKLLEVVR